MLKNSNRSSCCIALSIGKERNQPRSIKERWDGWKRWKAADLTMTSIFWRGCGTCQDLGMFSNFFHCLLPYSLTEFQLSSNIYIYQFLISDLKEQDKNARRSPNKPFPLHYPHRTRVSASFERSVPAAVSVDYGAIACILHLVLRFWYIC